MYVSSVDNSNSKINSFPREFYLFNDTDFHLTTSCLQHVVQKPWGDRDKKVRQLWEWFIIAGIQVISASKSWHKCQGAQSHLLETIPMSDYKLTTKENTKVNAIYQIADFKRFYFNTSSHVGHKNKRQHYVILQSSGYV